MELKLSKRDRWLTAGFLAAVFAFMLVFFYNVHPLVIFDADDWTYASYTRVALPSTRFWNPARILPEILMSGCSSFAVFALMPLVHDYIRALSLCYALVLSGFITVYTWCFLRLIARRGGLERGWNLLASLLFLLFHFLIFRTEDSNNAYMFISCNVTCYFYYTIPALLNCSLLMYFLSGQGPEEILHEGGYFKKGVLIMLCYLAVFSNLFASIILATYAGCELLFAAVACVREKESIWKLIREKAVSLGIFVLWCVSAVFELMGERAASFAGEESFAKLLGSATARTVLVASSFNRMFVMLMIGLILLALLLRILERRKGQQQKSRHCYTLILSGVIVILLTIVLSAKTDPKYISPFRADLIFGMLFFPVVLTTLCGVYIMKRLPWVKLPVPLLILVLVTMVNTPLATFAESNMIYTDHEKVAEMSRDVMEQIIAADRAGEREATIYVSKTGSSDNWPQATYMGPRISATLYKHGLISEQMQLTIVPSEEFNEKYGISFD